MATYYFDPEGGSNSNSGTNPLSPVKDWNAAAIGGGTFAPGDTLLMRAGTTYDAAAGGRLQPLFSATPTAAAPFRLGIYGDLTKRGIVDGKGTRDIGIRCQPIDATGATVPARWVTIENMEVKNCTGQGISIADLADTGVADAFNSVVNCYVHDITSTTAAAIDLRGQGITVKNCLVEDVGADGILFRGRGYCGYNTVRRVSNTGGGFGDGIQLDGGAAGKQGACIVEHNDVTRENSDKQAMLIISDFALVRFNTIRGLSSGAGLLVIGGEAAGQATIGNMVHGNYLIGTDGIFLLNAAGPHTVSGNVIVGTNPNETVANSTGIDCGPTYTHAHRIIGNVVRNHRRGIFGRNCIIQNNIVLNCGGTGIDVGVGAANESYNVAFGNGTNFSATPGTGSLVFDANPWLNSDGSLRMPGNPLATAGTYVQGVTLANGRLRPNNTPIGAYMAVQPRAARS